MSQDETQQFMYEVQGNYIYEFRIDTVDYQPVPLLNNLLWVGVGCVINPKNYFQILHIVFLCAFGY